MSANADRFGWAPSGALRLNNTMLSKIQTCTTQALLAWHHWTDAEEHAALRAGIAAHAALERYFSAPEMSELAMETYTEEYRPWAHEHVAPSDRLSYRNTSQILQAWMEQHPLSALPFIVRHTEIPFEVPLDAKGDIVLTGQMDADADLRETGDRIVVDHKTTATVSSWWSSQYRLSSQVSTYVWALRRHLGGEKVVGMVINAIEFSKLPTDAARKCRQHAVPYAECSTLHARWQMIGPIGRSPAQLAMWRTSALKAAQDFRRVLEEHPTLDTIHECEAQGQFTGACRGCPAQAWCETGRDLEMLPALMQHEAPEATP